MVVRIFITGEPRSGTTLVSNFLNSQKNITVYRDFLQIENIYKRVKVKSLSEILSRQKQKIIIKKFEGDYASLPIRHFDFKPYCFDSLEKFYLDILDKISMQGDTVVGHKAIRSHEIIPELLSLNRNIKIIYVLRDPRDIISSASIFFTIPWTKIPLVSASKTMRYWEQSVRKIQDYMNNKCLASNILVIRYEDLILDTKNTCKKLQDFLNVYEINLPKKLVDFNDICWEPNSSFGSLSGGLLSQDGVGRWKTISPEVGEQVINKIGGIMNKFGYN